jgi:hypothetical protein
MGERVRAFDLDPMDGSPPSPTLADPSTPNCGSRPHLFHPFGRPLPLPLLPLGTALYPHHDFLVPLVLPPQQGSRRGGAR